MTDTDLSNPELAEVEVHGINRASFLLKGALATGAVYGASTVAPFVSSALAASSDVDILNFALTLEYLETNFYQVKGKAVHLSGEAKTLAKLFGDEEAEHVTALTGAIKKSGGKPVAMPKFLKLAYTLENVGVGAYNGAGPSLKSKALLAAAGSIVQIEARHAASIAVLTGKNITPNGAFDKALTMKQVLAAASPLIKK
jgi:hypothetical protein